MTYLEEGSWRGVSDADLEAMAERARLEAHRYDLACEAREEARGGRRRGFRVSPRESVRAWKTKGRDARAERESLSRAPVDYGNTGRAITRVARAILRPLLRLLVLLLKVLGFILLGLFFGSHGARHIF